MIRLVFSCTHFIEVVLAGDGLEDAEMWLDLCGLEYVHNEPDMNFSYSSYILCRSQRSFIHLNILLPPSKISMQYPLSSRNNQLTPNPNLRPTPFQSTVFTTLKLYNPLTPYAQIIQRPLQADIVRRYEYS